MNADTVKVGQIWADNDKRSRGRKVKVLEVHTEMADGTPFKNPYAIVQPPFGNGRKTTIRLDRFRPNATGYTLVSDSA
jgi:hypothetical protein